MISEKISCKEAQDYLAALFDLEPEERTKQRVFSHLAECSACAAEKEALEQVWRQIGALPEVEVPAHLRDKIISRIKEMLLAEKPAWMRIGWEDWVPKPLAAIAGGIGVTFFTLWVLRRVTVFEGFSYEAIFLFSALFAGISTGLFLAATGSLTGISPRWRWAARISLLSLALTMVGTLFCPEMSLIMWWESLPPGRLLLALGRAISHLIFGVIYAFLPFFVAFLILGRKVKEDLLRQAIAGGAFFVFLLLPAIYLQAWPLSIGVFLSWAAGSLLGSFMGGLSGASVYRAGFWRYAGGA